MIDVTQTLLTLSACTGVAGAEQPVAQLVSGMLATCAQSVFIDPLGSVLATLCEPQSGYPTILLDAHMDEIGMIVTYIDDNGFLKVGSCGGVDRRLLLAQRVTVHGKEPVFGVVAAHSPHLSTGEERKKVPEMDYLLIDIGCSRERAMELVRPGDRVTIESQAFSMQNGRVCAKASDDRAGVAAVLRAAELIKQAAPRCGVKALLSVQEETGERGAKAAGFTADCDIALAVDVSFALTSDAPEHKCGKLGEGPMIGIAPTLTKSISDEFIRLAKELKIPYQIEVMAGETSTNADALGVAGKGAKTGLLSIPLRYMHTPVEVTQPQDIEHTARLLAEFVIRMGKQKEGCTHAV